MHGSMNVRNSPEDGTSVLKHVGDGICQKLFIAECTDCKKMGGTNNVKEQNLTLNNSLSLNEGTAAGRHLQGHTDLPLRQTNCPSS